MPLRRLLIPALSARLLRFPAWAGAGERGDAAASAQRFTLRITAGNASNEIEVRVSADGLQYVITANGAIPPAAGCRNPPGEPTELRCTRASIAAIAIEANGGNDTITARQGRQRLHAAQRRSGLRRPLSAAATPMSSAAAPGPTALFGRAGPDQLFGDGGNDRLSGGLGKDVLRGGPGTDVVFGGPGRDDQRP